MMASVKPRIAQAVLACPHSGSRSQCLPGERSYMPVAVFERAA